MSAVAVALQRLVAPYVDVTLKDGTVHTGNVTEVTGDTLILAEYDKDGEYPITEIRSVSHNFDCKCQECMVRRVRLENAEPR